LIYYAQESFVINRFATLATECFLIIRYFKYQTHKNSGTFQGVLRTKIRSRVVQDFQGAYKACLRLEKLEMVSTEFNLYHFIDLGPVVQKLVNFNPGLALTLG
jgi:hypothetical protein